MIQSGLMVRGIKLAADGNLTTLLAQVQSWTGLDFSQAVWLPG
jgi:hypothetical protein